MIHKIDYQKYEKPSDFVRFPVGQTRLVIVSNGGMVKKHGMKTAKSYVPLGDCTETPDCKFCLQGNEPKQKWIWIVFNPKDRQVKVLDVGPMIGDAICKQAQEKGVDPNGYEVVIDRTGTMRSTQYTTTIGSKFALTDKDLAFIKPAKKFLVKKYFESK